VSPAALPGESQRIDKWLWHARMVRTRSDAASLVQSGFVRINGKRVATAGRPVRIGDVVTLALDRSVKVLQVEDFCARRGASPAARALYRELATPSGAKASAATGLSSKVAASATAAEVEPR
jgi:ribosome-associated heat shock protein Hsp15